ncbi:MAG: type I methionyl aminopeptidase [Zetaproteobacteria bacterium]|nr:type I methionyl aminopeptidase [Pseudobdellovibrionaceae bacterium]
MIILKSDEEIDKMRQAGKLACKILDKVEALIAPGITTEAINELVERHTRENGATSAPLNYKGFPKSVCTSINDVVCHGIPSKKVFLKEGDIINVDVTPILNGYHGDSSRTFLVGNVSKEAKAITECAKKCLELGISAVHDGCRVGDIGFAIQSYAESLGYGVVRDFVGHGIGKTFHEEPQIYHFGKLGKGTRLTKGMVFTIEPMINERDWQCEILEDGWTAVTADGLLSAQFEHTVAIRNDGSVQILTAP